MKKIFIIGIMLILLLCGCGENETDEHKGAYIDIEEKRRIELYNRNLEDVVITDEIAIDIGNSVLKSICGEEIFKDTEGFLTYYKQDAAYLFTRPRANDGRITQLDGAYVVAISKIDGAILGIWRD